MTRLLIALLALLSVHAHGAMMGNHGWDWEARKWQTNIATASGTLSATSYLNGTTYMQQAKRWDIRPLLGRVGIYLGGQTNAMQCPIIKDWFSTTDGNDDLIAFVAGDYTEATGLTGNATTKYLRCNGAAGLACVTFTTISNFHMSVYVRTASSESSYAMGATSADATVGFPISFADATYLEISSVGNQVNTADVAGTGHYVATRTASNARAVYKNGATLFTSALSDATTMANTAFIVHAFNSAGTPTSFNSRTFSYYAVGLGVPDAKKVSYNILVQGVQKRANRAVP